MGGKTFHGGRHSKSIEWTDEEIQILVDGYYKGLNFRQISDQLRRRSRNSVIGKLSRLIRRGDVMEKIISPVISKEEPDPEPVVMVRSPGNKCRNDACKNSRVINLRDLCSACDRIWIERHKPRNNPSDGLDRRPGWVN